MIDLSLGFVVCGLGAWSIYLTGHKKKVGWLIGVLAEVGWVVYAILLAQWTLLPWSVAYAVLFTRNWFLWRNRLDNSIEV